MVTLDCKCTDNKLTESYRRMDYSQIFLLTTIAVNYKQNNH
jgi:hypothetical protein